MQNGPPCRRRRLELEPSAPPRLTWAGLILSGTTMVSCRTFEASATAPGCPRTASGSSRRRPAERAPLNAGLRAGPSGRMVENGSGTSRSRTGVDSSLLKRYGTLDEQAAAITFLASDEASDITGTVLPVAGGDLG